MLFLVSCHAEAESAEMSEGWCVVQAAIATLGTAGKVADMDLDEVETTEKKTKKKDKKKRTAAEVEADIGTHFAAPVPAASCIDTSKTAVWQVVLKSVHSHRKR